MPHQSKKVLVALSGGVDSAVAAWRLLEAGYDVSAAYMRTWINEEGDELFADCPWEEDIRQAKAVCAHLGIPFEVVNLIEDYRERVVRYLVDGYRLGITPNPDVMCNREMKFGVFRDYAMRQGFDAIATGHYCQRRNMDDGSIGLFEGVDKNKDQSYFLAMVQAHQLNEALFPIGDLPKPRVREIACEQKLPNASRKDSQGICFLGKVDINRFLEQFIENRPGPIIRQQDGAVLGQHQGLHRFTLGQRKGIGVPSNTDNKNFVVVGKDFESNTLVVAFDEPDTPGLYQTAMRVHSISWLTPNPPDTASLLAKPRYRDPSTPVSLSFDTAAEASIEFASPQRALARGQVVAFYTGEQLVGGAVYR